MLWYAAHVIKPLSLSLLPGAGVAVADVVVFVAAGFCGVLPSLMLVNHQGAVRWFTQPWPA